MRRRCSVTIALTRRLCLHQLSAVPLNRHRVAPTPARTTPPLTNPYIARLSTASTALSTVWVVSASRILLDCVTRPSDSFHASHIGLLISAARSVLFSQRILLFAWLGRHICILLFIYHYLLLRFHRYISLRFACTAIRMTRLFIHLVKQKQAGVLIGRLWVFLLSLGICLGMVSLFIIVLPGLPHEWHGVHGKSLVGIPWATETERASRKRLRRWSVY